MAVTLELKDKVALITGGSRGIGAAAVRLFTEAGAKVVFTYQKAREAAERVVAACGPDNCLALPASLDGAGRVEAELVEQAVERFGHLDILVGNHGVWPPEEVPVDRMERLQWRSTLACNLDSIFELVKHSVGAMKRQGNGGHVVLVSSTAGQRGEAFHCDYAASKGAIISLVKGLSTELASDNIRVNCVAPGWVDTEMAAPALRDPAERDRFLRLIPLGRPAKPEEIAAPILFLCTAHAAFITGEIFNVNGGAVLPG